MIEMLKKMGLALAMVAALSVNVSAEGADHSEHEQTEDTTTHAAHEADTTHAAHEKDASYEADEADDEESEDSETES